MNRSRKNTDKDGKSLYIKIKVLKNAAFCNTMKNLTNRIDVRLMSKRKNFFKMDIKTTLYVTKNV